MSLLQSLMSNMRKNQNLVGRRVMLIRCNDPYSKVKDGTKGTVTFVDDLGTIHVEWDDGRRLGLVYEDGDRWQLID